MVQHPCLQTIHGNLGGWWFEFLGSKYSCFWLVILKVPDLIRFIAFLGSQSIQKTKSGIIAAAFMLATFSNPKSPTTPW